MLPFTDPITLFTTAVQALKREDWTAVAALCDSDSLTTFRREVLNILRSNERDIVPLTVERYAALHPEMPREAVEYFVNEHNQIDKAGRRYAGFTRAHEAENLSGADVFSRWLASQAPRAQLAELDPPHNFAWIADQVAVRSLDVEAIGFIDTGEAIVHVFYRPTFAGQVIDSTEPWFRDLTDGEKDLHGEIARSGYVASVMVRRQPDRSWRLVATHDFFGLDAHLAGFSVEPTSEDPED